MKKENYFKKYILAFVLVIILIIILYFIYQFYNKRNNTSEEKLNSYQSIALENNTNKLQEPPSNITTSSDFNPNSIKTVIYEFTSADYLAAEGNLGIFKIYELTDSQMNFEYNHAWNFEQNTIDRQISETAEINNENLYEFNEDIDEHKYTIKINFSEEMITLYEYSDSELISQINLWS